MAENRFEFLKKAFPNDTMQILEDGLHAVILNPSYRENVNVYYNEGDDYTPFAASSSFQHCHLTDEEDVVDWINEIVTGKKLAIEFFKDGKDCFGGDMDAEELEHISYEELEQHTGYFGLSKLLRIVDSFKARGWNIESNFDAVFVLEKDGTIAIEKMRPS